MSEVKRGFAERILAASAAVLVAGCSSHAQAPIPNGGESLLHWLNSSGAGKIKHVVFIVQENRSFDNMFMGYPGADTVTSGKDTKGDTIALQPESLTKEYVIDHSAEAMFAACHGTGQLPGTNCRMDGFNREEGGGGPPNREYVYVPKSESRPYWDMARQWVVADEMFQSQLDESFVAHQYIIAAQASSAVDLPTGEWGCGGGRTDKVRTITAQRSTSGRKESPCFDYTTLADELDAAKLSWRFYASTYGSGSSGQGAPWSGFLAVKHIRYGPDWKNVISPNWQFLTDVGNGQLSNFTWITPVCDDSDHVACAHGGKGPSWVAALVNAVGKSTFWNSTAIFVMWDDWGGLYDHVPPPYLGTDSLGFRVPLLVISPYAKQHYVSHVQYETASVLRFAEDLFGLAQLSDADARASSPAADCFDFSQPPRPFVKIKAPYPAKFFIGQYGGDQPPDYE